MAEKNKQKTPLSKIAILGFIGLIIFLGALILALFNALFLVVLALSPILFWKMGRKISTMEELNSICFSLMKFWGVLFFLLIIVYLFFPVIIHLIVGAPQGYTFDCQPQQQSACDSEGCIMYALRNLCAASKSLLGVFAMLILLHIIYLFLAKKIGSRYLK